MKPEYHPFSEIEMTGNQLLIDTLWPISKSMIYRGVKDSSFDLLPSAFRDNGRKKLMTIANYYTTQYGKSIIFEGCHNQQTIIELLSLKLFYSLANSQGLAVPNMPQIYFGDPHLESYALFPDDEIKWMPVEWVEIAALAQHYGIPTRMLDWSTDMNVAIYFAIRDIDDDEIHNNPDKMFSIWQMDRHKTALVSGDIRFVIPKYCENPNLKAQSGVLTWYNGYHPDNTPLDKIIGLDYEQSMCKSLISFKNTPVLRKINVRYDQIPIIKDSFDKRGLTHSRFFPGLSEIGHTIKSISESYSIDLFQSD